MLGKLGWEENKLILLAVEARKSHLFFLPYRVLKLGGRLADTFLLPSSAVSHFNRILF